MSRTDSIGDEDSRVHLSPVWRDRANFLIRAKIQDASSAFWEQLWARQVGDQRFELCCIPIFVYDLALGDEVETGLDGLTQYVIQRVVKRSGHYTFRVWFDGSRDPAVRDEVINELKRLVCLFEWYSADLLAIDADSDELAQEVADFLSERHQRKRLVYETGRTG